MSKSGLHAIEYCYWLEDLLSGDADVSYENQWRQAIPDLPWDERRLFHLDPDGLEFVAWAERLFEDKEMLSTYEREWRKRFRGAGPYRDPWGPLGSQEPSSSSLLSPWRSYVLWCYHLFIFTNSDVLIALVTGEERSEDGRPDLTLGMELEMLTAAWYGIPVVWIGTTAVGMKIAEKFHHTYRVHHPCVVSHLSEGKQAGLRELLLSLLTVPKPGLPQVFEPGVPVRFRHHVCRPATLGWEHMDLSKRLFEPQVRVHYGEHFRAWKHGPVVASPRHLESLNLQITDAREGLIEGDLVMSRPGVGHMTLMWNLLGTDDQERPWGDQLLDWDFVCGLDPHLTPLGFACGLPVTSLPVFLRL